MSAPKFIPGDLVFAKVKGYPPWPARVTSCESNRYKVFFYGTYEIGKVKKEDIWQYNQENVDKLAPKNLKKKGYSEGLIQIKTTPEIAPVDDDILDSNIPNGSLTSSQVISTRANSSESWVTDECIQYESTLTPAAVKVKSTTNIPPSASLNITTATHSMEVSPKDRKSTYESVNIFEFDDKDMELSLEEKGEVMSSSARDQVWKLPPPNSLPASQLTTNIGTETDFSFTKIKSPKIAVITPRKLEKENSAEEAKKIWLMVKSTNELIEINVEKEKPASFNTREDEIQWERETVRRIQSGEVIPPELLHMSRRNQFSCPPPCLICRPKQLSRPTLELFKSTVRKRLPEQLLGYGSVCFNINSYKPRSVGCVKSSASDRISKQKMDTIVTSESGYTSKD